jgi:zinc transporter
LPDDRNKPWTDPTVNSPGFEAAYLLDGQGGGSRLDQADLGRALARDATLWVHLSRDAADARAWLQGESGLDPLVVEALLAENTRPRAVAMGNGAMLFMRGVNLNPGADPDDMVSIRLWVEARRVISVRLRRLHSVDEICQALELGRGPVDAGDFVVHLAARMVAQVADVVTEVNDEVDELQQEVLVRESAHLRSRLTRLRGKIISLRRHLAPQRDALTRLTQLALPWLGGDELGRLREEADRVTRYVEDLDVARDRADLTHEELASRMAEQLNARMYLLSVVAAFFLPLSFLTGLLGINVGGIPLSENPWGFVGVVVVLLVLMVLQALLFRWRRWL